jgi:hypothetical protein
MSIAKPSPEPDRMLSRMVFETGQSIEFGGDARFSHAPVNLIIPCPGLSTASELYL